MICVSLARGRHRYLLTELRHLGQQGVDLVELRLDCIQRKVQVKRLLADRPCPVIATCRRKQDGGHWERTEEERLTVLRTAIAEGVDYVDLEDDIAKTIPRFGSTRRIISFHDFKRTPDDLKGLHAYLADLDADVVKIATLANHPNDNLRMLELVRSSTTPTVGLCMGEIGTPSRVLAGQFGATFTFAPFNPEKILAPGQIPWRQLCEMYRYDAITPSTKVYGVIADPVGHSLSPVVHNAACAAAGIDAVYLPFLVPKGHLGDLLKKAKRWPLAGLSVTIPHKENVVGFASSQGDLVEEIGAANTISFDGETGAMKVFNTDVTAAVAAIQESLEAQDVGFGGRLGLKTALILGAGGAARAIAFGLRKQGVEVTISSRTVGRAHTLAELVNGKVVEWSGRHRLPYDCVVNATPIGMHPKVNETPFGAKHLRPYMVVFDTVYNPENTLLVKEAQDVGCKVVTGVEMFVRQAAEQFKIWHGKEPPDGVMRLALKQATSSVRIIE
ncbi:MAG: shikimate dehydrogenase [Pirellulales bacterium]|nr:shikimate dehydrogenase [Pirellulales bacterium]